MRFQQVVERLSEKTGYTKREIRAILLAYKDVILEALAEGQDFQIWGIGWLRNRPQAGRNYRYWKTGEMFWKEPTRRLALEVVDKVKETVKSTYPLFQEKSPASKFGVDTDSPSS